MVDIYRLLHLFRGHMVIVLRVVTLSSSLRCRSETNVTLIYVGQWHCDDGLVPESARSFRILGMAKRKCS
jgi:hypothetical protein